MKRRLRLALFIVLAVVVTVAIAVPTTLYLGHMRELEVSQELQALQQNFVQTYGFEAELVFIAEPQQIYTVVWDESTPNGVVRHMDLYIDGLFINVHKMDIDD